MVEMSWRGDKITKHGARLKSARPYKPIVICNHISVGTMGSMYNTFANPNTPGSAHFGVGRDGRIDQYVRIERAAHTQGLTSEGIRNPRAHPIVHQMGVNPNLYCVGIEHEGYAGHGVDGNLTEEQFWSSCWLHKYIQAEVERIYGHRIMLNSHFVLGHYQIDPVRKPFCPGVNFPWARLYSELAVADAMSLKEYEERIEYQRGQASKFAAAFAVAERIRDLGNKLDDPKWKIGAEAKLISLSSLYPQVQLETFATAREFADRIKGLYGTSMHEGKWQLEAVRKLLIFEPEMKAKGLL